MRVVENLPELLSESISPKILMMNNYTPRLFTEMLCVQLHQDPCELLTTGWWCWTPETNIFQEADSTKLID